VRFGILYTLPSALNNSEIIINDLAVVMVVGMISEPFGFMIITPLKSGIIYQLFLNYSPEINSTHSIGL
jgi:hypothetical protein